MSAKNRAKAKAEQVKGRVKEAAGSAVGDRRMQAEGRAEKIKGDLHEAMEKVKRTRKK
ncbi:CsbD family protein [Streptomyces caatingaensis]|uniref:General stress protein CsbD n=1 Tax=Streptomyces caatingaensis TaxID=1678637 RepID=A0A0K9XAP0_9ACTN|nr:CsbD family protein [Streptomyces caatingaensis]KNB50490.1 general stress protein CsbD [Streptomyces caatingaensis]